MKKNLLVIVFSVFAVALSATTTQRAFVKLVANDLAEAQVKLYLIENEGYSEAFDNGYDVSWNKNTAAGTINVYAQAACGNLSMLVSDKMENLPLGITTNNSVSYTFKFTSVIGAITLYDAVTDSTHNLTEDGTYQFTADANQTITDRFIINRIVPAQEICFRYNALQISGHKGATVVVKNNAGTEIKNVTISSDYQEVDLNGQPAGRYTVEIGSEVLAIRIQ